MEAAEATAAMARMMAENCILTVGGWFEGRSEEVMMRRMVVRGKRLDLSYDPTHLIYTHSFNQPAV